MPTDEAILAFESGAARYESWYETAPGIRADRAEQALINALLHHLGATESILEVGCGTGHFLPFLVNCGFDVFGLDRSKSMLRELRNQGRKTPIVLGDAQALPIRNRSVSVSIMVTTLEFVPDPRQALSEAIRVARNGLIVVALHRYSFGGISRRLRQSRLLSRANDISVNRLRALIEEAAGDRLEGLHTQMALPRAGRLSLPAGDVVGAAAQLGPGLER